MPPTHLKALREYVANVLDYDPTNSTYQAQVDRLLNEADRRICTEALYTFAQKVTEVTLNADVVVDVTTSAGTASITSTAAFATWMEGAVINIGGIEYTIAWVQTTSQAWLTEDYPTTGTTSSTIMDRWLHLPQDCVQVMALARRSEAITPTNPGLLSPITQYEDEWNNLPLGETGLPELWVPGNPVGISAPRLGVTTGTAVAVAQGTRTVEVCAVHRKWGLRSSMSDVQTVVLTDLQQLTVTTVALDAETGLYREVYIRAPNHGIQQWRQADLAAGGPFEADPLTAATSTLDAGLPTIESEAFYLEERLEAATGTADRLRLYPRQSETMTLQLRYLRDHPPMVEDNDVSIIPPAHRMLIAYRALYEVLVKHNNPTLAELYRKRYDAGLLQLRARYLSQPSRRLVKGFLTPSQVPSGPYRRKKLVRL